MRSSIAALCAALLFGFCLSIDEVDDEAGIGDDAALRCGMAQRWGRRKQMEDRAVCHCPLLHLRLHGIKQAVCFLGVYDGHEGSRASQRLADDLAEDVTKRLKDPQRLWSLQAIKDALEASLRHVSDSILAQAVQGGWEDGSTAVVALLVGSKLIVGNVGNSRALLCKRLAGNASECEAVAVPLTVDHSPGRQDERARIEGAGGEVHYDRGSWRIDGDLELSRSIGDAPYRDRGLTHIPEFSEWITAKEDDGILLIASDGVFEAMDENLVCRYAEDSRRGQLGRLKSTPPIIPIPLGGDLSPLPPHGKAARGHDEASECVMEHETGLEACCDCQLICAGNEHSSDDPGGCSSSEGPGPNTLEQMIAHRIVSEAYNRGSMDNIAAVTVDLSILSRQVPALPHSQLSHYHTSKDIVLQGMPSSRPQGVPPSELALVSQDGLHKYQLTKKIAVTPCSLSNQLHVQWDAAAMPEPHHQDGPSRVEDGSSSAALSALKQLSTDVSLKQADAMQYSAGSNLDLPRTSSHFLDTSTELSKLMEFKKELRDDSSDLCSPSELVGTALELAKALGELPLVPSIETSPDVDICRNEEDEIHMDDVKVHPIGLQYAPIMVKFAREAWGAIQTGSLALLSGASWQVLRLRERLGVFDKNWHSAYWEGVPRGLTVDYKVNKKFAAGSFGEVWRAVRTSPEDATTSEEGFVIKKIVVEKGSHALRSGFREKHFGELFLRESQRHVLGGDQLARGCEHLARFVEALQPGPSTNLWLVFRDEGVSLHSMMYTTMEFPGKQEESEGFGLNIVRPSTWWRSMRQTPHGEEIIKDVLRQLLEALKVVHGANVTHRDVKPENILLRPVPDPEGGPKYHLRLIDFGSAVDAYTLEHLYGPEGPSDSEQTAEYVPPEGRFGRLQFRKETLHRAQSYDMWSVGVTWLELILGTPHVFHLSARTQALLEQTIDMKARSEAEKQHAYLLRGLMELCIYPPWNRRPCWHSTTGENPGSVATNACEEGAMDCQAEQDSRGDNSKNEELHQPRDGHSRDEFAHDEGRAFWGTLRGGDGATAQKPRCEGETPIVSWSCSEDALLEIIKSRDPTGVGLPNKEALNLLMSMLDWRPNQRPTAAEALDSPYLSKA
ncbi:unnamed protein product [Ostreobium quekettii]|uniref:Protein-serine/threonine phosphatase n=1 Tax=Ostreobium quekettii TaxID=121088 RepID=A0A8S1IL74_9CHLO|nr:unnamed protein product [Ostreobium quekettii]